MIAALYAVTMLSGLLVVLTPLSVSAECAWVLWQDIETIIKREGSHIEWSRSPWLPESGHTSNLDCMKVLKAVFEAWPNDPKVGDTRNAYRCLPDTVDPRGPRATK
jgi:hypothetical protein